MRLSQYLLNEWKVFKKYAGRSIVEPGKTILWMYVTEPEYKGLLYTYPDGTTYLGDKKLGTTIRADDPKATHKRVMADFYNQLGLNEYSKDKRNYIEDIYEKNVRGRIIGKNVYVYSSGYVGIEAKKYDKMIEKAINSIYDYVDEDFIK